MINDFNKDFLEMLKKEINGKPLNKSLEDHIKYRSEAWLNEKLWESRQFFSEKPTVVIETDSSTYSVAINGADLYTSLLLLGYNVHDPDPTCVFYLNGFSEAMTWDGKSLHWKENSSRLVREPNFFDLDPYSLIRRPNIKMMEDYKDRVSSLL
jgi:hypothetical protein